MTASAGCTAQRDEGDRRRIERELRRLEWQQAHREGRIETDETEDWERSMLWLERHGSYRELRVLLAALPAEDRRALERVFGPDRYLRKVGPTLQRRAQALVVSLAAGMPNRIRVPAPAERDAKASVWRGRSERHDRQRRSRDERLREAAAELGPVEAAARFGLSVRHVRRLLKQQPEREADLRGVSGAGL